MKCDLSMGPQCPYCGESIELQVDGPAGKQAYRDCSVCCRPIELRLAGWGSWVLEARRDDD